jgi:glucosamine-phosphate N-acetyltransferase
MATSEPLFPPSLISPHVTASFPDSYTVRPLDRGDHAKGFLDCLRVLSHVGDVGEAQFQERFDWIKTQGKGVHYHVVIEHESRIVGTGALIVERKLCVQLLLFPSKSL